MNPVDAYYHNYFFIEDVGFLSEILQKTKHIVSIIFNQMRSICYFTYRPFEALIHRIWQKWRRFVISRTNLISDRTKGINWLDKYHSCFSNSLFPKIKENGFVHSSKLKELLKAYELFAKDYGLNDQQQYEFLNLIKKEMHVDLIQ